MALTSWMFEIRASSPAVAFIHMRRAMANHRKAIPANGIRYSPAAMMRFRRSEP